MCGRLHVRTAAVAMCHHRAGQLGHLAGGWAPAWPSQLSLCGMKSGSDRACVGWDCASLEPRRTDVQQLCAQLLPELPHMLTQCALNHEQGVAHSAHVAAWVGTLWLIHACWHHRTWPAQGAARWWPISGVTGIGSCPGGVEVACARLMHSRGSAELSGCMAPSGRCDAAATPAS